LRYPVAQDTISRQIPATINTPPTTPIVPGILNARTLNAVFGSDEAFKFFEELDLRYLIRLWFKICQIRTYNFGAMWISQGVLNVEAFRTV
jgi:hypothetical protein